MAEHDSENLRLDSQREVCEHYWLGLLAQPEREALESECLLDPEAHQCLDESYEYIRALQLAADSKPLEPRRRNAFVLQLAAAVTLCIAGWAAGKHHQQQMIESTALEIVSRAPTVDARSATSADSAANRVEVYALSTLRGPVEGPRDGQGPGPVVFLTLDLRPYEGDLRLDLLDENRMTWLQDARVLVGPGDTGWVPVARERVHGKVTIARLRSGGNVVEEFVLDRR